jgi:aspartyl-tRNA(Asn)/glutamyl-tRNA(Gln) amidotransferase subunit A
VYAALGTDTGGSIRIPAALCGLVGLKPTFGRASLYGAVTLAWSLDHIGPLTRTVPDAALLLDILAGSDARDPRTRPSTTASRALATLEDGVRGVRVGILRDDGSGQALASKAQLEAWQRGIAALEAAGATLVEVDMPEMEDLRTVQGALLPIEAATFHEPLLRERLDDYGEFMRQRILAAFAFGNRAFTQAQQIRAVLRRRCDALFETVDLVSTPSQPDAGPPLGTPASTQFTGPFNTLGWPAVSIPVGALPDGRPLGMQIAGRPWDEATVLRAARAVELMINVEL